MTDTSIQGTLQILLTKDRSRLKMHALHTFCELDSAKNGFISKKRLGEALVSIIESKGISMAINELLNEADKKRNGRIEYQQFEQILEKVFVEMVHKIRGVGFQGKSLKKLDTEI